MSFTRATKSSLVVVDGVHRAVLQRQLALGRAAGGGDELQAQRPGPLAGDQAHAAGRGMPQHVVAGLQAFGRQRLLQQVLHRQALEHHAGGGVEGDVVGQLAHLRRGHDARFAVRARRVGGVGGAVTDLQVRDTLAHRFHHAGAFHAQRQRQRVLVQAGALVDVDEVQPAGVVADADLARAGLAHGHVDQLQLLGAAVGGDLDGARHRCRLLGKVSQSRQA
jgi:hypothetical protein